LWQSIHDSRFNAKTQALRDQAELTKQFGFGCAELGHERLLDIGDFLLNFDAGEALRDGSIEQAKESDTHDHDGDRVCSTEVRLWGDVGVPDGRHVATAHHTPSRIERPFSA